MQMLAISEIKVASYNLPICMKPWENPATAQLCCQTEKPRSMLLRLLISMRISNLIAGLSSLQSAALRLWWPINKVTVSHGRCLMFSCAMPSPAVQVPSEQSCNKGVYVLTVRLTFFLNIFIFPGKQRENSVWVCLPAWLSELFEEVRLWKFCWGNTELSSTELDTSLSQSESEFIELNKKTSFTRITLL